MSARYQMWRMRGVGVGEESKLWGMYWRNAHGSRKWEGQCGHERLQKPGSTGLTSVQFLQPPPTSKRPPCSCRKQTSSGNFEVLRGANPRRTKVQWVKTEYKESKPKVQDRGYAGGRGTRRTRMRKHQKVYKGSCVQLCCGL